MCFVGVMVVVIFVVIPLIESCTSSDSASEPVTSFSQNWEHGFFNHTISITNTDPEHQIDAANLTIKVYLDDGSQPEVKKYEEHWQPSETISVSIPARGEIQRVEMQGSGQLDGKPVRLSYAAQLN